MAYLYYLYGLIVWCFARCIGSISAMYVTFGKIGKSEEEYIDEPGRWGLQCI